MPRNAGGVYTLPNPPRVPDTVIDSPDENVTRDDIATELTNSLDRNGRGGMLAPFRIADGVLAAPGLAFLNEPGTGLWRGAPGVMSLAVQGTPIIDITVNGFAVAPGKLISGGTLNLPTANQSHLIGSTGPVSANTLLTLRPESGRWGLSVVGTGAVPGQDFGIRIQAGMDAVDSALLIRNGVDTLQLFRIRGDGNCYIRGDISVDLGVNFTLPNFGSDYRFYPATLPGADLARVFFSGGGAYGDVNRGSWIAVTGNNSGAGGELMLAAGNSASNGLIRFYTGAASETFRITRSVGATRFLVVTGGTAAPLNPSLTPSSGEMDFGATNFNAGMRTSATFVTCFENGFSNMPIGRVGKAIEVGINSGTTGVIQSYDRTANQYFPLTIASASQSQWVIAGVPRFELRDSLAFFTTANMQLDGTQTVFYFNKTGANARLWRIQSDVILPGDFGLYDQTGGRVIWTAQANDGLFFANVSFQTGGMISTAGGQGRFGGWYVGLPAYQGSAVEIGFSGGIGNIICYDRGAALYRELTVQGLKLNLGFAGGDGVHFPSTPTTASAANAHLDGSNTDKLHRSTSTLALKNVKHELGLDEARNLVMRAVPIVYTSKCPADNPLTEHVGFGAEQIAEVDKRFVTFDENKAPNWVQYPNFVVPLTVMVADHEARLTQLEAKLQ